MFKDNAQDFILKAIRNWQVHSKKCKIRNYLKQNNSTKSKAFFVSCTNNMNNSLTRYLINIVSCVLMQREFVSN